MPCVPSLDGIGSFVNHYIGDQTMANTDTVHLPRRPERFAAGRDLALGTYCVVQTGEAFTIRRTIGAAFWYPLTNRDNPEWFTWPSYASAYDQIENNEDLCYHPFWGR